MKNKLYSIILFKNNMFHEQVYIVSEKRLEEFMKEMQVSSDDMDIKEIGTGDLFGCDYQTIKG